MLFSQFFRLLADKSPSPQVTVELLREIVNVHHSGVGKVSFRYFPDFPGAGFGNFIWRKAERSSPHEDAFNDAVAFINSRYKADDPMRRMIGAKELMHVFDDRKRQTRDPQAFRRLLDEIESSPMIEDTSEAYRADRIAFWKATIALVPPWLRDIYREQWAAKSIKAHELAVRWNVPEQMAAAAMGEYYDLVFRRFMDDTPASRASGPSRILKRSAFNGGSRISRPKDASASVPANDEQPPPTGSVES